MIEGWRKSLEKAKQDAAKGGLDAAKDVEALTFVDPRRHERVFGLRVTNRAPHLLLDWRQYPHKARNLFSVCTLRDGTGVSSDSLSSYEQPKIGRPEMAKRSFVTSAQNVVQDQAGKIVDRAKAGYEGAKSLVGDDRNHNAGKHL